MKHIKLFENNNTQYYIYTVRNFDDDTLKTKLFDSEESCIKYTIQFIHEYDKSHNEHYECENIVNYEEILDYWNTKYYNQPIDFNYVERKVETFDLPGKLKIIYDGNKFNT